MKRSISDEDFISFPMDNRKNIYREDNSIFFYDDCSVETAYLLEKHMRDIYNTSREKYINIVIDSFGGDLCSMYDIIRAFPLPTIGWVRGYCCSAATSILLACNKRFMAPSSLLLIHSFQGQGEDYVKEGSLRDEHDNIVKQNDLLRRIYKERAKIPPKELEGLLKDRERFLTAEECMRWKIIDGINTFTGVE
jgi:ATP-dependent Clp protease, protease subunit